MRSYTEGIPISNWGKMNEMTDDKTNTISLDMHRFKTLVSTHGGNIAKWPKDCRDWAEIFRGDNAEAQKLLSYEKDLDQVLEDIQDSTLNAEAFSSLQYKIVSEATHLPQHTYSSRQRVLRSSIQSSSIQSLAACFMLCACLAAGMFSLPYLPLEMITATDSEQGIAFLEINPLSSWD